MDMLHAMNLETQTHILIQNRHNKRICSTPIPHNNCIQLPVRIASEY